MDALAEMRERQAYMRASALNVPGHSHHQHRGSEPTVHRYLRALLDPGSFAEASSIAGKPLYDTESATIMGFTPPNSITGWGAVQGRRVFLTADDSSLVGGPADGSMMQKLAYGEFLARQLRVPLIRLLDNVGDGIFGPQHGPAELPTLPFAGLGQSVDPNVIVPVCSAILGPAAGLGAVKAFTGHFTVMVANPAQSWQVHAASGTVDNIARSEADAFAQIRTFLSFLPSIIFTLPPVGPCVDPPSRRIPELQRPRAAASDVRRLISMIVDRTSPAEAPFFELGAAYGSGTVTAFARLAGRPVGILANDARMGAIDANGAQKTSRFLKLCEHFGIPVLRLVDQPALPDAERAAFFRHEAYATAALHNTIVPMFAVVIRRAPGSSEPVATTTPRVYWPSEDWGGARPSADAMIDPQNTRMKICEWAAHAYTSALPKLLAARQAQFDPAGGRPAKL